MSKAYESIMRGLKEIEAQNKGVAKLRTTVIEIGPALCTGEKGVKVTEPKAEQ